MLTTRIIPCLDVRDGRVVKGVRFQGVRDAGAPSGLAEEYERQGADEITLLDVSATTEGRCAALETIREVRECVALPLTVGGGVSTADHAATLLDAGADKVGVNTAAVERPQLLDEMAVRFGSQCTVLAVDVAGDGAGGFQVVVRSGQQRTGLDAIGWCVEAVDRGAGEILLTSWDRDGTREGYDLSLIERVADSVRVPIVASGGAANPEHMVDAVRVGAGAVLAASIFHFGEYTVSSLKAVLASRGVEVRR